MNFKMEIPPKIQITFTLEQGYTYYFEEESFSGNEPHYFVILNKYPQNDEFVYFVNATSKVQKNREIQVALGRPVNSYVDVKPSECSFIKKDSIFNCNVIHKKSKQALIDKVEVGKLELIGAIPDRIVKKLISGVLASPLVEGRIKNLLS